MAKGRYNAKIAFTTTVKNTGNFAGIFDFERQVSRKLLKAYKASLTATAKEWERKAKQEAKLAIKNIQGVYKAGFKVTPAIKAIIEDGLADEKGNIYFNVKGKRVQDLQKIWYRLKKFNESETATAKGASDYLHTLYRNIGLEYPSNQEAIRNAELFFEISSKVKQILQSEGYYGEALSYQRIWESVREEIEMSNISWKEMRDTTEVAERVVERLNKILEEIEEVDELEMFLRNK